MTTGRSITDIIERRYRERTDDGERFLPMAMTFVLGAEPLLRVGGRWDRRGDAYDQHAAPGMPGAVVRIHPGQEEAVRWFATWLEAHTERRDRGDAAPISNPQAIDTNPAHAFAALFALSAAPANGTFPSELSRMLSPVRLSWASFVSSTAPAMIFARSTAPFLICFAPTLPTGRLIAA